MSQEEKKHFLDLIREFDDAMLVSHAPDSQLRARPMAVAETTDEGDVFFVTSVDSPKVDELLDDARLLVTFQKGNKYVSLSGTAEFVEDRARIRELWQPIWSAWFPDGPEDTDIILIRVRAEEGEYWDMTGRTRVKMAFRGLRSLLTGTEVKPPESASAHGHVQL
ncbi:MAG: pyridoxamine 5'-phosphate oxidase family protein [Deltaproteobacteria bacterium]|nr:pyridoxamine 5'-phosphate oxidase family protein [Deltaproteobacteria bacterium]